MCLNDVTDSDSSEIFIIELMLGLLERCIVHGSIVVDLIAVALIDVDFLLLITKGLFHSIGVGFFEVGTM
jgi:hypothetical protein